jgi:pyruvate dehydrogenase E2 component (dihydrolipoamide acetyltransferase)
MEISGVWLQQFRQGYAIEGKKISYNDLILQAVGRVLEEQPRFNSVLNGTTLTQLGEVNIGIAADTTQGLMVPVVRDVPNLSLEQIAAESRRLVDAARNGRLQPDDMAGGTFTISNLGMLGVSRFTAIINPPQVAILAVGTLEDRVVAIENHGMAVRPQMSVTLAADHRALDGAACARFLGRLKETLETPGLLA